jgi:hypothetical protein
MCGNYGYQDQIENPNFDPSLTIAPETNPETIPNPETQSQFANKITRDFLMGNTISYELRVEKENVPTPTPPDITDPN